MHVHNVRRLFDAPLEHSGSDFASSSRKMSYQSIEPVVVAQLELADVQDTTLIRRFRKIFVVAVVVILCAVGTVTYGSSTNFVTATGSANLVGTRIASMTNSFASDAPDFCWKETTRRGAGRIPRTCGPDGTKIGLLCYENCPSGYYRMGLDCHQNCPAGFLDNGLFCRISEYSKGVGKRSERSCRNDGYGCKKQSDLWYPICKPGYADWGLMCRPKPPNCEALGLDEGVDLDCTKRIKIGKPRAADCESTEEKQSGLCYKKCPAGYKGVGPVCWAMAPHGMSTCGMGAAKDAETCRSIVTDQVVGPLQIVLTVAKLVMGAQIGNAASEVAAQAQMLEKLGPIGKEVADVYKATKETREIIDKVQKKADFIRSTTELSVQISQNKGDPAKQQAFKDSQKALELAAIADPAGIFATLATYTYPKCSVYFGKSYSTIDTDITAQVIIDTNNL